MSENIEGAGGFDKIHARRLTQLADHLEHGKLGHLYFDFSIYNNGAGPYCGTRGCAIGECPVLWPKDWRFGFDGMPKIYGERFADQSGQIWFGLSPNEYSGLFVPGTEEEDRWPKERVALRIRAFLKEKAAEVG